MRKLQKAVLLGAAMSLFMGFNAYAEGYWWVNQPGDWGYNAGRDRADNLRDGWYWIDGNRDGLAECYYFQVYSILTDTVTPDGFEVNEEGAWIVDGVVQERRTDEVGAFVSSYAYDFGTVSDPKMPLARRPLVKNGASYAKSVGAAKEKGWVQDQGWRYVRDNGTYVIGEWAWIKHRCYCFDENGVMYENTTTPDGFQVNEQGQWVKDGVIQSDLTV